MPRCWSDKSRTGYDVKEVLDHLPPKLAEELMDAMYKSTIARVPLFKDLDEAAMHEICLAMKPLIVLRGAHIFREAQVAREMYVIEQGRIQMSRHGMIIGVICNPGFFGESALQPGRRVRDRSAYALENSTLAMLRKVDCEQIAKDCKIVILSRFVAVRLAHPKSITISDPELIPGLNRVATRKAKAEAVRMRQLLQHAASDLGVPMDSSAMHHLLETVGNMTGTRTELEMELAAAKTLQRHARGWLARRRAQTRRGITEGVLAHTARGAVLSVPEAGLIATKIAKERIRKRAARRPRPQRSTTLSAATDAQAPTSTAREQAQVRRKRNWRGVYTARDDDVYEADIDKAKFQRVARKLVEQLTTLRLLQNAGKQEELGGDFAAQIDEDAAGQPGDDSRLASIERSVAAIQKAQQALLERMTERETKLEGMVRSLAEQTSHAMLLQAGVLTANLTPKKNA